MSDDDRQIDWERGTWAPRPARVEGPLWSEVEMIEPDARTQICRICGGRRRRGERDDEWVADKTVVFERSHVRRLRGDDGRLRFEADEPEWSRRHVACLPVEWWAVEQVAQVDVGDLSERALQAVLNGCDVAATAEGAGYRGGKPWGWVTDGMRAALATEVRRAQSPDRLRRCVDGRCGACGAGRSTRWVRFRGLLWQDGSRVAVCASCADVLRGVDPFDDDEVRLRLFASMAGMRPSRMVLLSARRLRLFAEVSTPEDRHGDALPWSFSRGALDALRDEAHTANPHLVIDPLRRKIAEARFARRARQAEEEALAADPVARLW